MGNEAQGGLVHSMRESVACDKGSNFNYESLRMSYLHYPSSTYGYGQAPKLKYGRKVKRAEKTKVTMVA